MIALRFRVKRGIKVNSPLKNISIINSLVILHGDGPISIYRTADKTIKVAIWEVDPKSQHNPLSAELEQLRRENQRLAEELRKAEIVIDIQKKVAALLGQINPSSSPEGRR